MIWSYWKRQSETNRNLLQEIEFLRKRVEQLSIEIMRLKIWIGEI